MQVFLFLARSIVVCFLARFFQLKVNFQFYKRSGTEVNLMDFTYINKLETMFESLKRLTSTQAVYSSF